jgi:hypothetical protein
MRSALPRREPNAQRDYPRGRRRRAASRSTMAHATLTQPHDFKKTTLLAERNPTGIAAPSAIDSERSQAAARAFSFAFVTRVTPLQSRSSRHQVGKRPVARYEP